MTIRHKRNPKAGEFEGLKLFIGRMFAASGDISQVAEKIGQSLPALADTVGKEHEDIIALTEALERLKLHNSEAATLAGSLMEDNEDLTRIKHEMRQLATISQLPPVLAQTSPEFMRDVLTAADPNVIKDALKQVDAETFEKILKALSGD